MTLLTKEAIRELLARRDRVGNAARERALTVLVANQTSDERRSETTKYHNDTGFQPMDARMMTSLAQQVARSSRPEGERLSERQHNWLLRQNKKGVSRIAKYHRQLIEAAQAKTLEKLKEAA